MSKTSNAFFYPLVFSVFLVAGLIIYTGISDTFQSIEYERELKALHATANKKDQLDQACAFLLKHPESTQAIEMVRQQSAVPGWESSLGKLAPLFDPAQSDQRFSFTYLGDWRIVEARYRCYKKNWSRAWHLFEERYQTETLIPSDSRRFIEALIQDEKSEQAWRYSLEMRVRFPDLQNKLLAVMIAEKSPFVRPLACDLALSCLEQNNPERRAIKLLEQLLPSHESLASSLLGSTFHSLGSNTMNQLRLKTHQQLTKNWLRRFQTIVKDRGFLVSQDIEPHVGPWGQPYRFDRQLKNLTVRQDSRANGRFLSVPIAGPPKATRELTPKVTPLGAPKTPARKP
ncbi:MAG: hypothetical protein P1V97_14485 [Planctomycetota bacterium]|nr:hypothetical protein [Planctomycetota bacterium]